MWQMTDNGSPGIKVFGVGGGGGNAVEYMLKKKIDGVDFVAANTDIQALRRLDGPTILQLGDSITKGLGAGMNPDIGREAALEDQGRIEETLAGTDLVFIAAGMGGGTGTGAAPVVARVAKDMDILTVAVVTRPFKFERRNKIADQGIEELTESVDSLITIPNDRLPVVLSDAASLDEAFAVANDVLFGAVQGIADLITKPGLINCDFADLRTVMREMGVAMIGTGVASGEHRAEEAANAAIHNPLLEDVDMQGARGVLINVSANPVGMLEFSDVGELVGEFAANDVKYVAGMVDDPALGDELRVTIVATGIGASKPQMVVDNTRMRPVRGGQGSHDERDRPGERRRGADPRPGHQRQVNYEALDQPAYERQQSRAETGNLAEDLQKEEKDLYLNLAAFLRKQAD